eukprot:jgi/Chlat1/5045/Chrsp33S05055
MMPSCLEEWVRGATALPLDLKTKLAHVRQLDEQLQDKMAKLEDMRVELLSRTRLAAVSQPLEASTSSDFGNDFLAEAVARDHKACLSVSEEKVNVALAAYDLVDGHIRRLDRELRKLEEQLRKERRAQEKQVAELHANKSRKVGTDARKRDTKKSAAAAAAPAAGLQTVLDTFEMPVDPNEPTYCYCNRVSFGQMIACDNPTCPIEWFHFECVGIADDNRPKGAWFCPDCNAARNKQPVSTI